MKKLFIMVSIVMAFILSGCTNQPEPKQQMEQKVVTSSSKVDMSMGNNGKSLYEKRCHKTKMRFHSKNEAHKYLIENKMCKGMKKKNLERVSCYLSEDCKNQRCGMSKCGSKKMMPKKCGASSKCGS